MHTDICDRLGIEFPIFAFSHCRDVVAAVTNAGGFGVLGATGHSPHALGVDLTWIDDQVRGKAYGVDLLLPVKYTKATPAVPAAPAAPGGGTAAPAARFPAEHQAFVDDLLTRYGVPTVNYGTSTGLLDTEKGENLDIDGLVKTAQVYALAAADLCGAAG